jgi:hypothetical protein
VSPFSVAVALLQNNGLQGVQRGGIGVGGWTGCLFSSHMIGTEGRESHTPQHTNTRTTRTHNTPCGFRPWWAPSVQMQQRRAFCG